MIYVFYNRSTAISNNYEAYLHQLPSSFQQKISRYRNRMDAQRSLFGKLLLTKGLHLLGLDEYKLSHINYTNHHRPYFNNGPDFNIAHSGEYVICAISKTGKIGVDIEEIKETKLQDYQDFFTEPEWTIIMRSEKSLCEFYSLWTQKESIMKAVGKGLTLPLQQVKIKEEKAVLKNEHWHVIPMDFSPRYISHLATDSQTVQLSFREITFD